LDLWAVLIPILLADILNPVLFAFMVYAAGSDRPIINPVSILLGHTCAYFGAGIVLALGFEAISERLANPQTIDFVIEIAVGLLLVWIAILSGKDPGKRPESPTPVLSPVVAFGFGAVVNFIGLPFALPYFATVDQILKADLTTTGAILNLAGYNLLYALPFAVVPVLTAALGERSKPILERINGWLDRIGGFVMPLILSLVGLALLADGIVFFVRGESLF